MSYKVWAVVDNINVFCNDGGNIPFMSSRTYITFCKRMLSDSFNICLKFYIEAKPCPESLQKSVL